MAKKANPFTGRWRITSMSAWEDGYLHLQEIGIDISIHNELPSVHEVCKDFLRQMSKGGSGLQIVYFPGPPPVDEQFPATARWVRESGWIELGQQQETGFVVWALDDGGVVFEDDKPDTLAEAMAALEKSSIEKFRDEGIEQDGS
jgi:hypothetical protein